MSRLHGILWLAAPFFVDLSHRTRLLQAALSAMDSMFDVYDKAKDGGLEELLRAGVDINTRDEVTPAAPSRVADPGLSVGLHRVAQHRSRGRSGSHQTLG